MQNWGREGFEEHILIFSCTFFTPIAKQIIYNAVMVPLVRGTIGIIWVALSGGAIYSVLSSIKVQMNQHFMQKKKITIFPHSKKATWKTKDKGGKEELIKGVFRQKKKKNQVNMISVTIYV